MSMRNANPFGSHLVATNDSSPPSFRVNLPPDCTTIERRAIEGVRLSVLALGASGMLYFACAAVRVDHSERFSTITYVGVSANYVASLNLVALIGSVVAMFLAARVYLGRISATGTFFCALAFATGLANICWFLLLWTMAAEA